MKATENGVRVGLAVRDTVTGTKETVCGFITGVIAGIRGPQEDKPAEEGQAAAPTPSVDPRIAAILNRRVS